MKKLCHCHPMYRLLFRSNWTVTKTSDILFIAEYHNNDALQFPWFIYLSLWTDTENILMFTVVDWVASWKVDQWPSLTLTNTRVHESPQLARGRRKRQFTQWRRRVGESGGIIGEVSKTQWGRYKGATVWGPKGRKWGGFLGEGQRGAP